MIKPYLHTKILGDGPELILLHGWGVNHAVFQQLQAQLTEYRTYCVDLPGFGQSDPVSGNIEDWLAVLLDNLPSNAIWLGWSLGGLIASLAAIRQPERVKALVSVSSSPCFLAKKSMNWPGVSSNVFNQFSQQLSENPAKTISQFLALQAMGSEQAKQDIKTLKKLVLAQPLAKENSLSQGLSMLESIDLRLGIQCIKQPWLRIWGERDGLVPVKVVEQLPKSPSMQDVVLNKASHAPFISHSEEFCLALKRWLSSL